ncbi:MAG TPA: hypothetical protein VGO40_19740 [Longimicrobium sp.]|nr:hypothetical protein [Longimicrobium sp.]
MNKLRLSMEDLTVESFATGADAGRWGTVHGNGVTHTCNTDETCEGPTCGGVAQNTCVLSCDTCDAYRCGTLDDCTNIVGCATDDAMCGPTAPPC